MLLMLLAIKPWSLVDFVVDWHRSAGIYDVYIKFNNFQDILYLMIF